MSLCNENNKLELIIESMHAILSFSFCIKGKNEIFFRKCKYKVWNIAVVSFLNSLEIELPLEEIHTLL